MDLPSLAVILQAAFSSNPQERKAAEESLNQFQHTPQHLLRLFQIIVDGNCDLAVRQVASIHFKNFIAKNWVTNAPGEQQKISPADKSAVRNYLLEYVVRVPPLLRVQLGECLKTIINADYPEQWPNLLYWVKSNLQDQQVYGALYVLRILSRKYEFKSEEERIPAYLIIDETFPPLLNIFNSLVHVPNPTIEVAEFIKLICKIFWSSIYLEIPKKLFDPAVFNAWMVLFLAMLERPVPVEGQPLDPVQRRSWEWWKVKKWTVHIMNRLHTRFGDPKLLKPENKPFAQMFQKHFAGRILECHLNLLNTIRQGGYLPDRVTNLILQYLSSSISKSNTYQILKPQLDVVLFEIIFPLMCFNDSDDKLWREDPHEYIRKGYDIIEDLYSPRTASIDFVTELVRKRGKENLQKFITYIVEIFRRYDEAAADCKPYRQKDGALLAIGALCDKLKQTEPYKSQLEHMLVQHVFPEFRSPAGHLRAKAAWVSGQYASVNFADPRNFSAALHSVISGLRDPELPVRVDSVFALRSFVEACKDLNEIRPILPQLLDEIFKLMNEVENEELVFTLETIVDKFGEEMAPYALGLCQNLCIQSSEGEEDSDESGALAAVGCLRAISTILESVSRLPHLFPQVEPILLPIMQRMLTSDGQDVFEETLEIVSYMTYFSEKISLQLWSLWPLMISALDDWAIDYFENILIPLDNYISRSTEHFLTSKDPDYQQSLFKALQSVMGDKNIDDQDIEPAPKLIEAVLQNCKGRVDEWVEPYLRITIDRLQRTEKKYLRDLLMEVIANALYYNPVLTLNILHKLGVATNVFNLWFQMLQEVKKSGKKANFKREHDKKVCILGLSPLLSLPSELIPEESLPQILRAVLDLLVAYKEQVAEAAKKNEEEDDDDMEAWKTEDDEDDSDKEMGVETEDGDEADSHKLQKLAAQARAFQCHADDEDAESEDEFSDDEEFQSPIDDVDPFIFFSDTMKALSVTDSRKFQNLSQSLDFHYQAVASAVTHHAEERRAEILKEKAEKAVSSSAT